MECPSCRASVPEGSRFCLACGHALSSRAEERRIVTVLFADLVGFTTFSEHADPEQLKNLVDAAFQRLVADIASHGGRVDKIVGDQIMALFGAPIAHEDDAERAVRAGLQMQATLLRYADEIGVPVRMRIGINSGEVLVGALRAGGEYTAMGDTVNVASRLQTTAEPGQVLVGPATYAQTVDVVRYESVGAIRARGRDELVDAYSAQETLAPPGLRRRRTRTPLIGRDHEFGILCSSLSMAFERNRPQLIFLAGEAGIGKSRLAEELTETASRDHLATILEGRCVPYGEANIWWPVAMAIRHALGIDLDDTAEKAEQKTRSKVSWGIELPPDDPRVQRIVEGLGYLLGIPTALRDIEPTRAREQALDAFVGMLQNLARRRPLVFAISELHWADQLVLDLVDSLPDRMRGYPFVLVATGRLEVAERWSPKPGRHNLVSLHIDPLDREASIELVTTLLEGAATPSLLDAVLDRSGGNPFFLEELAGLVFSHASPAELPATLRALVATRLDNLPAPERRLLDHATVVGRLGTIEALTAIGGPNDASMRRNLESLVGRDLLDVEGSEWSFRSDLVREVAYETLTKGERARHHARLGVFLRQQAQGRGRETEQVEALAHHFGMAAQLDFELGGVEGVPTDVLDDALHWIEQCVSQAELRETPVVAEQLCTRALDLLPDDRGIDRRRFLVRRARARATMRNLNEARLDVLTVLQEAEAANDDWAAAAAYTVRGDIEQREGALHDSAANLDEAIARWNRLGDRAHEADARRLRGMTDLFLGRLTSAEANIAKALALFEELGDRRGEAWAKQNMAWISVSGGDIPEANRRINESIALFEEIGDRAGLGWAYGLLGWVRMQEGFLEEAEALALRVLDSYESGGDVWAEGMMHLLVANTQLWLGRTELAIDQAVSARELFATIADSTGELRSVATLSRSLLAAGELNAARDLVSTAAGMSDRELDADGQIVGRMIANAIAVQLGESTKTFTLGELLEPSVSRLGGIEEEMTSGMALLQLGRSTQAQGLLVDVFARADTPGSRHAAGAALALSHAAAGAPDAALEVADRIASEPQGTYLDRIGVAIASGFAHLQRAEPDLALDALHGAIETADGTGDRLNQALSRLALAVGLEALADATAAAAMAEARSHLTSVGLPATDWEGVFRRAAGGA